MGRMKDLLIKLQEGAELTETEQKYVDHIKQQEKIRNDIAIKEAIEDMELLDKIDPPDDI